MGGICKTHLFKHVCNVRWDRYIVAEVESAGVVGQISSYLEQDLRLLDAPNATASAPDHPSTPLSMPATLSTPPRTESPSGSVSTPQSERDRMLAAVAKLESSQIADLTDLLMSLPKRERAMCLFNVEVLRAKIADAKLVLEVDYVVLRPGRDVPP